MKKINIPKFVPSGDYSFTFRTFNPLSKRMSWWVVTVEYDVEEPGTWHCLVFQMSFRGHLGEVRILDRLHEERITTRSKSPMVVARCAMRHFLYDLYSVDDLPF